MHRFGWWLLWLGLSATGHAQSAEDVAGASSQPASRPAALSPPSSRPAASRAAAGAASEQAELAELERALRTDRVQRKAPSVDSRASAPGGAGSLQRAGRFLQRMNPQIALIADVALAVFSDSPQPLGAHDPQKTGFNLQQLELSLSAEVDPYFRFDANIVFSKFGVELEEAYGTTLGLPWNLQARVGQLLQRFGRVNASHPHAWLFVDQPLVLGKFFGGEGLRGLALEVSWLTPLPWYVELIASVAEAGGASSARSFFGADDLGVADLGDFLYVVALKQFFALSDNWSLAWGVSAAFGPNATGRDNDSAVIGSDLYLKYRPIDRASYTTISLEVEWLYRTRQVPLDLLRDSGLYAQLFYRFAKRWATAARYEYVSGVIGDALDPEWVSTRQRASANITFWPTEFSRLRAQYAYDHRALAQHSHAALLAIELVVGAHGAHKF